MNLKWPLIFLAFVTLIVVLSIFWQPAQPILPPIYAVPTFVGRGECRSCHQESYDRWHGSDHDKSMDVATEATVLGDFGDVTFTRHNGDVTRFFRQDGKFMVTTEGVDGAPTTYEITHVFGHDPLQQYLVPFPGGRMQCLTIAWDAVAKRWYNLYAGQDVPAGDWLHWTGRGQTWNTMCAECHSTELHKGYDPATDTYQTTWKEIDVSCEACHGPASNHLVWSALPRGQQVLDDSAGFVVQTSLFTAHEQVNSCAPCHARRQVYGDITAGQKLTDTMSPELLREATYHADGQILAEDYVYGSFAQSKMYHNDVRCSNCHDPHSLQLRFQGNQLCAQCHEPAKFDTPTHHHHAALASGKPNPGTECTSCHMPQRTYMGIDQRADHSIRIPRPDMTASTGSPDACSRCHADQPLAFSVDAFHAWYGGKPAHFGALLAKARLRDIASLPAMVGSTRDAELPAIARASFVAELANLDDPVAVAAIAERLSDGDPLVRKAAVEALSPGALSPEATIAAVYPLLNDRARSVRISAVPLLANYRSQLTPTQLESFEQVKADYITASLYTADMPGTQLNLGNLAAALGDTADAERHYRFALRLDSGFVPAAMNLAVQLNSRGQNEEAHRLLERIRRDNPNFGEAAYSLGLLYGETQNYDKALDQLQDAARLLPDAPRVHYNLAQLASFRQRDDLANTAYRRALELAPSEPQFLLAAAQFYLRRQRLEDARYVLTLLQKYHPAAEFTHQLQATLEPPVSDQ